MFIIDLQCANEHAFEGWYDSVDEYREIKDDGELSCPLCGSLEVERVASASNISTSKTRPPLEVQRAMAQVVQEVRRTHEDVGDRFAEVATKIAKGTEDARPIRGTSTAEEETKMRAEGVPFLKVPIPDIESN